MVIFRMKRPNQILLYSFAGIVLFILGLVAGWHLNVEYTNKPALEFLAVGMTDTMYRSAIHLNAIHKGNDEIFKDVLLNELNGGLKLLPKIESYLVTEWGKNTVMERKQYTLTILDCIKSEWKLPECEEI